MAKVEIKGTVTQISDIQSFEGRNGTVSKKTVVVHETEEASDGREFNSDIAVDFWDKSLDRIDRLNVGDFAEITASVRSREYTNKEGKQMYFTSLNGFFCKVEQQQTKPAQQQVPQPPLPDDLPF